MEKNIVRSLAITTSSVCNLECSYCFLCKEDHSKELDREIVDGLISGTYATNCFNSLKAYGADPKDIVELQLWGGEPTIHADIMADHVQDWLKCFPKLERISISSNGKFDPETVLRMLEAFAQGKYFKKVLMQISIDGPDYVSQKSRGITFEDATKNYSKLLQLVSKSDIFRSKGIQFLPAFKNTLPIDTINEIHSTIESATKYYEFWASTLFDWENTYVNHIIKGFGISDITVTLMPDYTQAQGLGYAHSCRVYDSIDWQKIFDKYPINDPYTNLYEQMSPLRKHDEFWESTHNVGRGYYCGQYIYATQIMPDGTIYGCLAGLYNNDKNFIEKMKKTNPKEYLTCTRIAPQYYWKPTEHSKEENLEYKDHKYGLTKMQPTQMAFSLALMHDLSVMGQISPIYKQSPDISLRHAYLLSNRLGCYFNNIRETGVPYVPVMGLYRLYCNGVLEYYDSVRKGRDKPYAKYCCHENL